MSQQKYADLKIKVDDEGFLENPDDWNEKVAWRLAEKEGVEELTKDRMEIIKFLREHYRKYNFFPILRSVCRMSISPKECVREQFMWTLYCMEGAASEAECPGNRDLGGGWCRLSRSTCASGSTRQAKASVLILHSPRLAPRHLPCSDIPVFHKAA